MTTDPAWNPLKKDMLMQKDMLSLLTSHYTQGYLQVAICTPNMNLFELPFKKDQKFDYLKPPVVNFGALAFYNNSDKISLVHIIKTESERKIRDLGGQELTLINYVLNISYTYPSAESELEPTFGVKPGKKHLLEHVITALQDGSPPS